MYVTFMGALLGVVGLKSMDQGPGTPPYNGTMPGVFEEKTYVCGECEKKFGSRSGLSTHVRVQHGEGFVCEKCGKEFKSNSNLGRHKKSQVRVMRCLPIIMSNCSMELFAPHHRLMYKLLL